MIKCLVVICLLGLTVSAFETGKRSNRMNMLSRHVNARMLAGTSQDPTTFQMSGNSGFVPIPRQSNTGINSMQQTSNGVVDNNISGQQLTPEQLQQLQQFLSSQQQQQQPQQQQPQNFQSTQQIQQQQQPSTLTSQFQTSQSQQPPQQVFRMDSFNTAQPQPQQFAQQQQTNQQARMIAPTTSTTSNTFGTSNGLGVGLNQMQMNGGLNVMVTTTTPTVPISFSQMSSFVPMTTTTTPVMASKPSPNEQALLDQQIKIQRLKEQLFNMQQQEKVMQQQQPQQVATQASNVFLQTSPQQQFQQTIQQSQALQQQQLMQQEHKQQQKINMQQQLIDQMNQMNQQNIAVQQQQPTQNFQTQQFATVQQPVISANISRMATQVRPMPVQQQQQMFNQNQQVMPRSSTNICAGMQSGDLLPHPLDETQFIVCGSQGEITLMDCPNHTVFNPHLKLCDLTSEMPTLCKSNPCLNGAKCIELSPLEFQCECPQGFSGRTCEKFDTCTSSAPCGSDGVCLSFALGSPLPHVCLCNGGRSVGMTCQQSEQNPCLLPGSSTKLMGVNFNRAVFAHCEGARPHFKFCQPPLLFSAAKQACEWSA